MKMALATDKGTWDISPRLKIIQETSNATA